MSRFRSYVRRGALVALCAACGSRTGVLGETAEPLAPDAGIDAAPPPPDARDVALDVPGDVRDAAPDTACDACVRILANGSGNVYELHAPEATIQQVSTAPVPFFGDIALSPDKTVLFGAGGIGIATIDMTSWQTAAGVSAPTMVALEIAPDGTFYGAEWDQLYTVSPKGGNVQPFGQFPDGLHASGDLAFAEGLLYATVFDANHDALVEIDVSTRKMRVVGTTSAHCIFGLASGEPAPVLYGLTCIGELVQIDRATGETRVLKKLGTDGFLGATRL